MLVELCTRLGKIAVAVIECALFVTVGVVVVIGEAALVDLVFSLVGKYCRRQHRDHHYCAHGERCESFFQFHDLTPFLFVFVCYIRGANSLSMLPRIFSDSFSDLIVSLVTRRHFCSVL